MSRAIYVFGTGHALVTRCYNACFGLVDGDGALLLDAGGGNGILSALEAMGVPWVALRGLFLSHTHTDHILGGVWVIRAVGHAVCDESYRGGLPSLRPCRPYSGSAADLPERLVPQDIRPAGRRPHPPDPGGGRGAPRDASGGD